MQRKKRVLVSVSNDLVTDQRVARTCETLADIGFEVVLLGRKLRHSPSLPARIYSCKRLFLLFTKGPLFYAELNLRLFFYLLFRRADFLFANDLDTLTANTAISALRRIPLVYDSHEYFTGVPELISRPLVRNIWKRLETLCLPHVRAAITVNDSIAEIFRSEYSRDFTVIRNLPKTMPEQAAQGRPENLLPAMDYIILQGNGINIDRGGEEAVLAMQYVEKVKLLIVGAGDVIPILKNLVKKNKLEDRVFFIPRQHPEILPYFTRKAIIGLSLDKPSSINQRFSLPNKLFDYINNGVPVLVSDLPEVSRIVSTYKVGRILSVLTPENLAAAINEILNQPEELKSLRSNCRKASAELSWENEKQKLIDIFEALKNRT